MRLKRVVSQPQWEQELAYLFCRPEDPSFPRAFPSSFFRRPPSPLSPPPSHPGSVLDSQPRTSLPATAADYPSPPFPLPDGDKLRIQAHPQGRTSVQDQPTRHCSLRRVGLSDSAHAQSRLVLRASSSPGECSRSLSCHGQPWSLRAAPNPSSRARPDIRPVRVFSCLPRSQLASGTQAPAWRWPTQTSRLHLDRRILSPLLVLRGWHPKLNAVDRSRPV